MYRLYHFRVLQPVEALLQTPNSLFSLEGGEGGRKSDAFKNPILLKTRANNHNIHEYMQYMQQRMD